MRQFTDHGFSDRPADEHVSNVGPRPAYARATPGWQDKVKPVVIYLLTQGYETVGRETLSLVDSHGRRWIAGTKP